MVKRYLHKMTTFIKMQVASVKYRFLGSVRYKLPVILSIEETIDQVVAKNMSVARFGDSEYLYMSGGSDGLQQSDKKLQEKLKNVINNTNPKLMVCLVDYNDQTNKSYKARMSAMYFHTKTYSSYVGYLDFDRVYGNSNMTRFYINSKDKSHTGVLFEKCKKIWDRREVIIFEGENTRFGYGNDLFDNASTIGRVLCPSKMAFDKYDEILDTAKGFSADKLLIFALGASATAIAGELADLGHQAIDIGNLDVEYEWFRLGVSRKVALEHKQVSEVIGGTNLGELADERYLSQIIARIGV